MFLGGPASDHLLRIQIDHGNLGVAPQADVDPMPFLVDAAGVREHAFVVEFKIDRMRRLGDGFERVGQRVGRQGDVDDGVRAQIDDRNALPVEIRNAEFVEFGIDGQSGGDTDVVGAAQLDVVWIREKAVLEMITVDDFVTGAAAKQL